MSDAKAKPHRIIRLIDQDLFGNIFSNAVEGTCAALTEIAIPKADLSTPVRLLYFLAQCGHESAGFAKLQENLNYTSAGRICAVWPSKFKHKISAIPYISNPKKLANAVYAGRYGNGDEASGDGWRYRGRGWIGLTFKNNYRSFFAWAGTPEDTNPDFVSTVMGAALSAAWYWDSNHLNALCDKNNFVGLTKKINPALAGINDRKRILATIEKLDINQSILR